MDARKIIEIRNVSKAFGDKLVVDNVNLTIKKGEFVTLLGPSGCGKTTLLRMIAGFETPTSGSILINDRDVKDLPPHLRPVNTVFQKYALFPNLNVAGNIAFGLKMKKLEKTVTDRKGRQKTVFVRYTKAEIDKKVRSALKMVGLTDYEERDVTSLSGGQQQRVAIARAIVNEPEVLLLDEPLGALDLKMRKDMQFELKRIHDTLGITFLYVTHDQEEALTMSDTIVVLKDGVIRQIGTPAQIYREPKSAFVADFVGESNIFDGKICDVGKVRFGSLAMHCDTEGFSLDEDVDVVIRPEDIYILSADKEGHFYGEVTSSVFKGMHYEMLVSTTEGYEFKVHDANVRETGEKVALFIRSDDLTVMKLARKNNRIRARLADATHVEIDGGAFEIDPTVLAHGAEFHEDEGKYYRNGEVLDLTGREVVAEIEFEDVKLHDYEEDGVIGGNVASILFKGDHYHLEVKSDAGEYFYVDTLEQWDDGDRVGITLPRDKIRLTFAEDFHD